MRRFGSGATAAKSESLVANRKKPTTRFSLLPIRAFFAKRTAQPQTAMKRLAKILAPFVLAAAVACSNNEAPEQATTAETSPPPETTAQPEAAGETTAEATEATTEATAPLETEPVYGYTYGQASGNLVVDGEGGLPLSDTVDVPLDGSPVWVAGIPFREGVAWVVALEDGSVEDFHMETAGGIEPLEIAPDEIPPGAPPLVGSSGGSLELVEGPGSPLTHPLPVEEDLVGVTESGEVFVENEGPTVGAGMTAPPDARFTRSPSGAVAFLSEPTERYAHGVLGDGIEADSITVADIGEDGGVEVRAEIVPESGGVFEEVAPMWVEADGSELLAVSESADGVGTRVALYEPDGSLAAAGPFIEEPFKWRHVLAAGPFGPNGEFEVAAVRTPHLDSVVEFYRPDFDSGTLEIVAEVPGYTSHRINTRNLDTARAGDLDGDGRWELLVPDPTYTGLAAIRRSQSGAEVAWTLPAEGGISTNIASATDEDGRAFVAVGRSDGTLRIWR